MSENELPALWTVAGRDTNGQLGVVSGEGRNPNASGKVETFTALNKGELPDSEHFTDVSEKLSNSRQTLLAASDGNLYASGRRNPDWDDSAFFIPVSRPPEPEEEEGEAVPGLPPSGPYDGGTTYPRRAELVRSIAAAEAAAYTARKLETDTGTIPKDSLKSFTESNFWRYSVENGWRVEHRAWLLGLRTDGTAITLSNWDDGTPVSELGEIAAEETTGNTITDIVKVMHLRNGYANTRPMLLDIRGALWAKVSDGFRKIHPGGVTHVAQDGTDSLLVLVDGKLLRSVFVSESLGGPPTDFGIWRRIGRKTFAAIYSSELEDPARPENQSFNTFLLEPDGTLWAKGSNTYGELGVGLRAGAVAQFSKKMTSSKVEKVIPRDGHTFIKKKE